MVRFNLRRLQRGARILHSQPTMNSGGGVGGGEKWGCDVTSCGSGGVGMWSYFQMWWWRLGDGVQWRVVGRVRVLWWVWILEFPLSTILMTSLPSLNPHFPTTSSLSLVLHCSLLLFNTLLPLYHNWRLIPYHLLYIESRTTDFYIFT